MNIPENISVIITAGGIGKRMNAALPKQFLVLGDYPLLIHTLMAFHKILPDAQFVITLPESWNSYWEDLLITYNITIPHHVVSGGIERYHSVSAALSVCQGEYIFVHDGVRPIISSEVVKACILKLNGGSMAVIPVVQPKESLRMIENAETIPIDRSQILIVQTPQCFKAETLRHAYTLPYESSIYDDASLAGRAGYRIDTVEGNRDNIKITEAFDLKMAELLLK